MEYCMDAYHRKYGLKTSRNCLQDDTPKRLGHVHKGKESREHMNRCFTQPDIDLSLSTNAAALICNIEKIAEGN